MYWGLDDVSKWCIIKVSGIKTKLYLSNNNLDILVVLKDFKSKKNPILQPYSFKKVKKSDSEFWAMTTN